MTETVITREDLFDLFEYSCSLPTLTTIGKRWRLDVHAYRENEHGKRTYFPDEVHEWKICEYVEIGQEDRVGIKWTWAVDENHEPHRGTILATTADA